MTPEQKFADYIAAFNRQDWTALCRHYDPDVELIIGNGTRMVGHQAITDFYRAVNRQATRTIEILDCFANGPLLAAEIQSEFLALGDAPDFPARPLAAGDRLYINSFVFYEMAEDKFVRIRAAVFQRRFTPARQPD